MEELQHMACSDPLGVSARLRVCARVFMLTLEAQTFDWKKKGVESGGGGGGGGGGGARFPFTIMVKESREYPLAFS